jgi:hypothetical protein
VRSGGDGLAHFPSSLGRCGALFGVEIQWSMETDNAGHRVPIDCQLLMDALRSP